ncbi:MoaD/ThiS family protein [Pseudomonadota bacterium]
MKISYFASLRDSVGYAEEEITLPPDVTNVGMLINWLSTRGPRYEKAFEFIEVSMVIVNRVCVQNDEPINDDDEVMFVPPIAGG